jgi:RNA polymerase subunit RPABC4/transcription elongation factor Spt4
VISLSHAQQRTVKRLMLRRGEVCPQCDSPELSSDGTAMKNISNVSVGVYCTNQDVEHPQGFWVNPSPLSDDEAREVGIDPR